MIKELFYFKDVIYVNKSQKYNFKIFVVFNTPNNNNNSHTNNSHNNTNNNTNNNE